MEQVREMKIPPQNPPVQRELLACQDHGKESGVTPAQTQCDSLPGLAQQMCYLALYGVET